MDASLIRSSSQWSGPQIDEFLRATVIPARLACSDQEGVPLICSLWFIYADDAIWCATQAGAHVVTCLRNNERCGFEVAPETQPYRGVRGQGRARIVPEAGRDFLQRMLERYLDNPQGKFAAWLMSRADTEVAIRIEPEWITAWDFSARMGSR